MILLLYLVIIVFMIITADFGGSSIKIGLVENDTVLARSVIESYASQSFSDWIPSLKQDITNLCDKAGVSMAGIDGMVWALPLIIAPGLRYATHAFGKFVDATHEDFCVHVEDLFQFPLLLENDARAALIGEWQYGAACGKDNVVMITLGTGLGTGVILNGKPLRGRSGMAGNLGGLSITHLNAPRIINMPAGCTETQIATWALQNKAQAIPGFDKSLLACESKIDYKLVFELAEKGDILACKLRDYAFEGWGAMALNMIQAFDPECVIFGGGIMSSRDMIIPAVKTFVNDFAVQAGGEVDILPAALGNSAALLGGQWIWNMRNEFAAKL